MANNDLVRKRAELKKLQAERRKIEERLKLEDSIRKEHEKLKKYKPSRLRKIGKAMEDLDKTVKKLQKHGFFAGTGK